MKPHGSIRVVRKCCGMHANPILRCLEDPEGLNNGHMPSEHSPQVHEMSNGLRLSTVVSSQDLSGAWVIV
jgi:hypothetical protein